ncbi:MAG: hypothetical protein P4M08_14870 [Oligoflexia bacterium]|nr:hypothetical protein [Oligoflexia bacterium]
MRVAALLFDSPSSSLVPLAEACLRFSPQLCLKRPGAVFIEIGKCRSLYREETFLARLSVLFKRFGLNARVALADSLIESLILAKYGTLDLRRLGTDTFVDYLDPFLSDPHLRKTAASVADSLKQVGVASVERFLQVPASQLPSRFGAAGLLLRSRIMRESEGESDVSWPLWVPEERVAERLELFDGRCRELEPLLFDLKPVLDRAFSRLWGRGLRASSVSLALSLEKFSTVREPRREWRFEFLLPQATSRGTLPILRERLERDLARKPLESPVLAIDLEVLQTVKDYQGQRHFFHSREDVQEAFNSALSQLAEGLGKERVFRARIHEEPVAERSWSRAVTEQKAFPDLADYIPLRPTRLLKRPEKIQLSGEMIFIRGRGYRILKWSSVERIATHWIDQEVVRSYYRIDLEGKSSVWVFKSSGDEYYLHGYFA